MKYSEYMDKQKTDRKNEAIICAAQLFLERGIQSVKMTDIADVSEIGVATLYRYFKTKKQIVIAAAIYIWNDLTPLFSDKLSGKQYEALNGYDQAKTLANLFVMMFTKHRVFLKFIHDFDVFVLIEGITAEELEAYENSILNFASYFEKAVKKGRTDKSINNNFDSRMYYMTATHSLMALSQKLSSPKILSSDTKHPAIDEFETLVEILLKYIEN